MAELQYFRLSISYQDHGKYSHSENEARDGKTTEEHDRFSSVQPSYLA